MTIGRITGNLFLLIACLSSNNKEYLSSLYNGTQKLD
jgi:hypothetical protein